MQTAEQQITNAAFDKLRESYDTREQALIARIWALEDGLHNIEGMAAQFDADADFRAVQDIAATLLEGVNRWNPSETGGRE